MVTMTDLILTRQKKSLGYLGMHPFLDRAEPPTAVCATTDVSVVGFDDTCAPYFAPPLTTVEQPIVDMGKAAATLVFQRLAQPGDIES
jgi:hypothetical protein